MGIGDWGLGIGDWAQSPIPKNFFYFFYFYFFNILIIIYLKIMINKKNELLYIFT